MHAHAHLLCVQGHAHGTADLIYPPHICEGQLGSMVCTTSAISELSDHAIAYSLHSSLSGVEHIALCDVRFRHSAADAPREGSVQ